MIFLVAAILPWLYWDQGVDTAPALKQAGIERFYAPPEKTAGWKQQGLAAAEISPAELAKLEKLATPRVQFRMNVASATRIPWIDSNGWRLERAPGHRFYYDVPAASSALAAAEAFSYGADALIHTDPDGLLGVARVLKFARQLPDGPSTKFANIGVVDDGSREMGELMNLLTRHNLLFRVVPKPDPRLVTVQFSSPDYPRADAANSTLLAQRTRQRVTDEKRILRVYGSDVVLGHMTGDASRARLYLVNYGGRNLRGVRIRVLGNYPKLTVAALDLPNAQLQDVAGSQEATEFTFADLGPFAVVDLVK